MPSTTTAQPTSSTSNTSNTPNNVDLTILSAITKLMDSLPPLQGSENGTVNKYYRPRTMNYPKSYIIPSDPAHPTPPPPHESMPDVQVPVGNTGTDDSSDLQTPLPDQPLMHAHLCPKEHSTAQSVRFYCADFGCLCGQARSYSSKGGVMRHKRRVMGGRVPKRYWLKY